MHFSCFLDPHHLYPPFFHGYGPFARLRRVPDGRGSPPLCFSFNALHQKTRAFDHEPLPPFLFLKNPLIAVHSGVLFFPLGFSEPKASSLQKNRSLQAFPPPFFFPVKASFIPFGSVVFFRPLTQHTFSSTRSPFDPLPPQTPQNPPKENFFFSENPFPSEDKIVFFFETFPGIFPFSP